MRRPRPWFTNPPHWGISEQAQRETIQAYYASISFLDANVGRVLDALDRLRLTDNTIVVFISDHGYHLGEQGQWMKQTLFERSARAPLIVAGPGVTAKGASSSRIVEFLDLYPTLAALAGRAPARRTAGPLAGAAAERTRTRRGITRRSRRCEGARRRSTYMGYSVRTEKWRYTEWDDGKRGAELYDEAGDPRELRNLAADPEHQKVVADMQRLLRRVSRTMTRLATLAAGLCCSRLPLGVPSRLRSSYGAPGPTSSGSRTRT